MTPASTDPVLNLEHLDSIRSLTEDEAAAIFQDLKETYVTSFTDNHTALTQACTEENAEETRKHIHAISGSSANLGLNQLATYCRTTEEALINKTFTDYENCSKHIATLNETGLTALTEYIEQNC